MNKLVVGNLVHRPIRSLISVLAVAIEVIMILSIAAIMMGKLNGSKQRTSGIGMDMIVQPAAVNSFIGMSPASASVKVAEVLGKLPHVQVAAPMNIQLTSNLDSIAGIDFKSYDALTPFEFVEGKPFSRPDAHEIIIDDYEGQNKHVGQEMKVLGKPFTVVGIVKHGKGGRKFIPIVTMGELTATEGKATNFYLKTEDEPKWQETVRSEILHTEGLENYSVKTLEEQLSVLTPAKLPAFSTSLYVVTGIAVVVGFLVIFQSMYTAVMERTREIGILKSLGASRGYIVSVVLRESVLLAAAGIVLGVGASYLLGAILQSKMPTLEFVINGPWVLRGVVLAIVGAILGALYPAWKAASKDPIDALAYD